MRVQDIHIHLHDEWSEEARKAAAEARRKKSGAKAKTQTTTAPKLMTVLGKPAGKNHQYAALGHAHTGLKKSGYSQGSSPHHWVHPSGHEVEIHPVGGGMHQVLPKGQKPKDPKSGEKTVKGIGRNPD